MPQKDLAVELRPGGFKGGLIIDPRGNVHENELPHAREPRRTPGLLPRDVHGLRLSGGFITPGRLAQKHVRVASQLDEVVAPSGVAGVCEDATRRRFFDTQAVGLDGVDDGLRGHGEIGDGLRLTVSPRHEREGIRHVVHLALDVGRETPHPGRQVNGAAAQVPRGSG